MGEKMGAGLEIFANPFAKSEGGPAVLAELRRGSLKC